MWFFIIPWPFSSKFSTRNLIASLNCNANTAAIWNGRYGLTGSQAMMESPPWGDTGWFGQAEVLHFPPWRRRAGREEGSEAGGLDCTQVWVRCGHHQLNPGLPLPAKGPRGPCHICLARDTYGWISPLLYNHCYYKQMKKKLKTAVNYSKAITEKQKQHHELFFRDRFQRHCYVAPISFLSLDLGCYTRSSCQAKQLLVTPGKWLYRYFMFSIALSLHFRAKSLWHSGINAELTAGVNTLGRTSSEKQSFPQDKWSSSSNSGVWALIQLLCTSILFTLKLIVLVVWDRFLH